MGIAFGRVAALALACLPIACGDGEAPLVDRPLWQAEWIFTAGDPAPKNFYLYARKRLLTRSAAKRALVHVTADSRYKLYVNGHFVGRGPVRADQRWQYYDTYDLAPLLTPGENIVAAVIHQFGAPNSFYTLGRGGLLVQGDVHETGGARLAIDTDRSWRLLPATAWQRDVARATPGIQWMEIYDAREEPSGWMLPGFDDTSWQEPKVLGTPPVEPWQNLLARDIPFLREEERYAEVIDQGTVEAAPAAFWLDFAQLLGGPAPAGEVFGFVHSPVDQRGSLAVKAADGMSFFPHQAWVDGVAYQADARMLIDCPLRAGWNEVLVKVQGQSMGALELTLGPAEGASFQAVTWYAERDLSRPHPRAVVAGPELERAVLGRAPGTPVTLPGTVVPLQLAPSANVAVRVAMERLRSGPTPGLVAADKLLRPDDGPAVIRTSDAGDVYVTLDFGRELAGFVRLRLQGVAGGVVDLAYSETLFHGHVDPLRDAESISYADRYTMRDGAQEWELYFPKAFRYVQLTFRNCPAPVEVESVTTLLSSYAVDYRGRFESSDDRLNQIWEVGRWTLQLCMQDSYEDGPWREQSQWVGDAQVELLSNDVTFGDVALGTKYLRQVAQAQADDGALPPTYPGGRVVYPTPTPTVADRSNTLPTFMLQWVSTLRDHLLYTEARALAGELYPNVQAVLAYFAQFVDADGLLANVPGFAFYDWSMLGVGAGGGELTGLNAHYYRALLDAAELARAVSDPAQARAWLDQAAALGQAINDHLWLESAGLYAHSRRQGQLGPELAVHDSILAAYAGLAPADRMAKSLDRAAAPAAGVARIGSPYFYFFYLQALRRAGRHQEALDAMRMAYGAMLDAGASSWWEHFTGYASLAHGWSTGPNYDLSTFVLGVAPTEPGFARFQVAPEPGDLAWARGTVPSPKGDIEVSWSRAGGAFALQADVPDHTQAVLSAPAESLESSRLEGPRAADQSRFASGRVEYWVSGPGRFRVSTVEPSPRARLRRMLPAR